MVDPANDDIRGHRNSTAFHSIEDAVGGRPAAMIRTIGISRNDNIAMQCHGMAGGAPLSGRGADPHIMPCVKQAASQYIKAKAVVAVIVCQ